MALRTIIFTLILSVVASAQIVETQQNVVPIAIQSKIDAQAERIKSDNAEQRRDAVYQLLLLRNAAASRIATTALSDSVEIIRATAAKAVVYMADEAIPFLTPLLNDKAEFVRREAAFALGETHGKSATPFLITTLQNDKRENVRASAALALGELQDPNAIPSLTPIFVDRKSRKQPFLQRSVAIALGKIRDKQAVPALTAVLQNPKSSSDLERESAFALGEIADESAIPILQSKLKDKDYRLGEIAAEAIKKIEAAQKVK
ncbi:MAG: HEAT repeat domain-containing protein [Pyrinomonadaceae bacterium]|nr:HEAT repeat domain-containing protein [Pyrinomonadaceae bacterium]